MNRKVFEKEYLQKGFEFPKYNIFPLKDKEQEARNNIRAEKLQEAAVKKFGSNEQCFIPIETPDDKRYYDKCMKRLNEFVTWKCAEIGVKSISDRKKGGFSKKGKSQKAVYDAELKQRIETFILKGISSGESYTKAIIPKAAKSFKRTQSELRRDFTLKRLDNAALKKKN